MSEKHLTELSWKALAVKNKVKDTTLQKAFVKFSGCNEDDYEGRLKALKEIEGCASDLKKENKANKEIAAYLDEVIKEMDKNRKAVQSLKKGAEKNILEPKQEDDAEKEESGLDLKGKLIRAMKKVQMREPDDPPMEALVCKAGPMCAVLLAKKVGASQRKELLELLKDQTGHKFVKGTCEWGEGNVYAFVLESLPAGAVKGLKAFFKEQTAINYKLQVRDLSGALDPDLADTEAPREQPAATQPPTAAQQPAAADPMVLFKNRFEAMLPTIKEAIAAAGPTAQDIKLTAGEAGVFANKKDFAQANRLLDAVEALLKKVLATAPPPPARESAERAAWGEARWSAVKQLRKLGAAITAAQDPEAPQAVIVLEAIAKNLTLSPTTMQSVEELERYLQTDDVIAEAEAGNPFDVVLQLREPLLNALAALKKQFPPSA